MTTGLYYAAYATPTNAGTISGSGQNGIGIFLRGGGSVSNELSGTIYGAAYGIYADGRIGNQPTTVTNAGVITAGDGGFGGGVGIYLLVGGSVTNSNDSSITGGSVGISFGNFSIHSGEVSDTVDNYAVISGTGDFGVSMFFGSAAGTVDLINHDGGTITGGRDGVLIESPDIISGVETVTNFGAISGGKTGVIVNGGQVLITNYGAISGAQYGVILSHCESIQLDNKAGGTIYGAVAGVQIYDCLPNQVTNDGTISGSHFGVQFRSSLTVSGTGDIANSGSISAFGHLGVGILLEGPEKTSETASSGDVDNQSGGIITGYNAGIVAQYAPGTVTNAGTIKSVGTAAELGSGGFASSAIDLLYGGSVNNESGGVISGANIGVSISNVDGAVTNDIGAVISGGKYGVYLLCPSATVINAGTISGTIASIDFSQSGANSLTLETGSVLNGDVIGSAASGATNALVLEGQGVADNNFQNFTSVLFTPVLKLGWRT